MSEGLIQEKGAAIPEFFTEPVELTFKSAELGRPVFEEQEFVRIWIPGDRNSAPVERVNDGHKARWPKQYEAFKAGLETPLEGTPLKQWPPIKRSQVLEFAHFHIHTVEQLAGVNDSHLQHLGMGARELREQARTFLEVAQKGTAPIARMVATIERQADEITVLKRLVEDANARIKALETPHAGAGS